jgi:hypothetical protein
MGDKHSRNHLLFPSLFQITEVQAASCSTVQWAGPTISRRFWHGKCSKKAKRRRNGPEKALRSAAPHGGHELLLWENAAEKKLKHGTLPKGPDASKID